MYSLMLNWRRNLFFGILILLLINGFFAPTKQLCAEWWVEKQRMPCSSWQIVRRTVVLPPWYTRYQNILIRWQRRIKVGLIIYFGCHVLRMSGLFSMWLLKLIVLHMMRKGIEPLPFHLLFSSPLKEVSSTVNICMMFNVLSDSNKEIIFPVESNEITRLECVVEDAQKKSQKFLYSSPVINLSKEIQTKPNPVKTVEHSRKVAISTYDASIEQEMRKFYNTLSEKDKRRYAGIEALKKDRGCIVYIASVLSCNRKTVSKGIKELQKMSFNSSYEKQIRKSGGGRKRYHLIHQDIDKSFLSVLKNNTAGDPMSEDIKWTNLTHIKIAELLAEQHRVKVSTKVIRQLLKKHNYRRRKIQKKTTMKEVKNRNNQFENINKIREKYQASCNPIISLDTKKKENLGNFYRDGHLYTQEEIHTYDHDFASFAEGVVIPHAIYDCKKNTGYINLGTSKDTGEFACDCIRNWWYNEGQYEYYNATSILILCDGGGSNSSRQYLFKEDLQKLVNEIGIEIRIAHYPPYCSKYNPIEHRLFPHVTRACQGVIFKNMQIVKELMEKTNTRKGLRTTVQIVNKVYETGRKVAEDFKENMTIVFDKYLSIWNYRAIPNG